MKLVRLRFCVFVLALLTSGWGYGQVYKWVDENGKVHFGDKPPVNSKAEELNLPEVKSADTPEVTHAERIERQRRLVKALEEERKEKQKAKQEKKDKEAKQVAACKQLKGRIKHSETINRYFRYDEQGERTYYSDAEADAFRNKLKAAYQQNCES